MEEALRPYLQEIGGELRDDHDPALIADAIGEVERLESDASEATAKILRMMADV